MTPKMIKVESSAINYVGYDHESKTLYLEFHAGRRTYAYYDVEQSVYDELLKAPSIGAFVAKKIVGYYDFGRID